MRKVTVELKVVLTINVDEGIEVSEVINELDYDFISGTDGASVEDTEIKDHEVTDSR